MKQLNFNTEKNNLSENDISQIISIVGYRCRTNTRKRLHSILKYSASSIPEYGIYTRLMKEPKTNINNTITEWEWSYCAGQSYLDEIRTLRECLLGRL